MPCSNDSSSTQKPLHEKLTPGSVFLFKDFHFENTDETKDKYGIILSNSEAYYAIIICLTTSKVEKYKDNLSDEDYVFVPVGTSRFFPKETMILIRGSNLHKIEKDKVEDLNPKLLGTLESNIYQELIIKLKASNRISKFVKDLL